jgi:predicted AlkP superfamily pyrophosphatase or phosphodiesterase
MEKYIKKISLCIMLFSTQAFCKPKLIIGIVVDQMRYDYLYRFDKHYSKNGFKLLLNEGFNCKNTKYNYVPTYTGPGHASVFTGATPAVHGIISNNWFEHSTKKSVYCCDDSTVYTLGSSSIKEGKMSPKNCMASTFGDELKLFSPQSKVIGIALKDRGAILPAGHLANAAYWLDSKTGSWISSTFYYSQIPNWVTDFNNKKISDKIVNSIWNTSFPIETYIESLPDSNNYEEAFLENKKITFPYSIKEIKDKKGYGVIKEIPMGNSFTKDFAIETIEKEALGKDEYTDVLTISFSATDYVGHRFGISSKELQDTYIKLDNDLAQLIEYLDKNIGRENFVLFLTADHGAVENPNYLKDKKLVAGYINEKKIKEEVKSQLKKNFSDSIILAFDNQQFYLNHDFIKLKKLDLDAIKKNIINTSLSFSEVLYSFDTKKILEIRNTQAPITLVLNGIHSKKSGDVVLVYQNSFIEEDYGTKGTTHGAPYSYDTRVPLIWLGATIQNGNSTRAIEITDIAPTISNILNTALPSGTFGQPIHEILK